MDLLQRFNEHIKKSNLFSPSEPLILGISGGLDSVVLCHLLLQTGHLIQCAHVNFGLRDLESDRDEHFVRAFCEAHQLDCNVLHPDTKQVAEELKMSIQEAARKIRYDWFLQLSEQNNGAKIITAHHADDNIETMMMYLLRGTGIQGLSGMPAKNGRILRPLLPFTRKEIEDYAKDQSLEWVEDSSNLTTKYTRNLIRNRLLPFIYELFPSAQQNLYDNLPRFRDASLLYQQAVELQKKKLLETRGNDVQISILKLLKSEPVETLLFECIRPYGFSAAQLKDVMDLCEASNGKYVASSTNRIIRNRKWLVITGLRSTHASMHTIEEQDAFIHFENGDLHIKSTPASMYVLDRSALVANMDRNKIKFPLLLRKWRQGDYFYPLGMKKKKKVSRFMIDQKLSMTDKEKTWVVESDKKIIWVVGMRIDERFRITNATKEVISLRFEKKDN